MFRLVHVLAVFSSACPCTAADWPQWRGPDRSNVAPGARLLATWPKDGPPLVWTADGLGTGVPSVAVADGRVYVLGYRDGKEHLSALAEKDGKPLWSVPVGPEVKELPGMRWLSQRTPTVDGERIYAFTARGELICVMAADGKEQWRKDYVKDFGGKAGYWGYCDFPLADGDRLVCTPGGKDAALVALNKKTGAVEWKCAVPAATPAAYRGTYGGVVAAEIAGMRQYIHQLEAGVVGVRAADGALLWHYSALTSTMGNVHTALVRGDEVFASYGWGAGVALLRVTKNGDSFKVEEVYRTKQVPLDPWLGSSVRLGEYVHAANGLCLEWKTGVRVAQPAGVVPTSRITMTAAGGRLIHRNGSGLTTLTEVAADGTYTRRGEFRVKQVASEPTWSFPVVANGRLYLRDQATLACYDLRDPDAKPAKKLPAVIFVPTPDDVVAKMLEMAKVTKDDTVVDLGCGDGRIVVAAAKGYGCRAIGYDLDPACVELAKGAVDQAGVGKLVRIEEADVLDVDLSQSTIATLYLGTTLNAKLVPQLAKMKPGSRVVSHAFPIPGLKPDAVLRVTSRDDNVERPLYRYTVPFTRAADDER